MSGGESFTFSGGIVEPGETANIRYTISETYLGDPVRLPITIVNGDHPGPTICLTAAAHGDELNGIEVVRRVAHEWNHEELYGTLVCIPVMNVPAFIAQERYLPIYDRDLNRSFPGDPESTSAKRMANTIFTNFIQPCDIGLDFHTSTRGRSNMLHVRADMEDSAVSRLARSFGSNVIIDSEGPAGTLRKEASDRGTPTITIEMGEAHRFQRNLIEQALRGVESVFAEYGVREYAAVNWPGWRTVIVSGEKTWLRSDVGGIVEMHVEQGSIVEQNETICTITNPFKVSSDTVIAPFTGLLVGVLENPVVYPGNPLCHLVELDEKTQRAYHSSGGGTYSQ